MAALLALVGAGCASGRAHPSGPLVSPTGIVYAPGTRPKQTRFSETAALYLSEHNYERGLKLVLQGVDADSTNPLHYFLAGSAYARLGRYVEADTMFAHAERIYPAYQLQVEPERESAWAIAFNAGAEAYQNGDVDGAIRAWQNATVIFDLRPEAHLNLARLLAGERRYGEAISVYQAALRGLEGVRATRVLNADEQRRRDETRVGVQEDLTELLVLEGRYAEAEPLVRRQLELHPTSVDVRSQLARVLDLQGKADEATRIYTELLSESSLEAIQLLNLGVGLFHASKFQEAGEAFRRLTMAQPESRDAWFNYANALFAAEAWSDLTRVGGRLLELDPLGENAALITAKAHLQIGDQSEAMQGLRRCDAAPVHLDHLYFQHTGAQVSVRGQVRGNAAEPRTPVRLRFEFYDPSGSLGAETVVVMAPPRGETAELAVAFAGPAAWYRYEVLAAPPG